MFERYTEKARRVIFFARYEASQLGGSEIDTEHLLLGLLRESRLMVRELTGVDTDRLRDAIERDNEERNRGREKVSTSVDMPLANDAKQTLGYAAEEADVLGHRHIGTEHLLLALLRQPDSTAARILTEHNVDTAKVRERLAKGGPRPPAAFSSAPLAEESYLQGVGGCLEFLDAESGERVGIIGLGAVPFIPRVGEIVLLAVDETEAEFRVMEVKYDFRPHIPGSSYRVDDVEAVRVFVSRRKPGGLTKVPLEST